METFFLRGVYNIILSIYKTKYGKEKYTRKILT